MTSDDLARTAAAALGWIYSPAHGGYINEGRRRPGDGWDSYVVADDPAQACWLDGLEDDDALRRASAAPEL